MSTGAPIPLGEIVARLAEMYGAPDPPASTDPLELILWENVVYLASEERRTAAFLLLKRRVGTEPEQIVAASDEALLEITRAGIMPELQASKLRTIAEIALSEFDGDLRPVLCLPPAKAKKALQRFPSIGKPAAEKILLFARACPVLALDSNGLRVLLRLGYGTEQKSYAASYRSAQEAVGAQVTECAGLIAAHQLLKRHGQATCRRALPACESCSLAQGCPACRT